VRRSRPRAPVIRDGERRYEAAGTGALHRRPVARLHGTHILAWIHPRDRTKAVNKTSPRVEEVSLNLQSHPSNESQRAFARVEREGTAMLQASLRKHRDGQSGFTLVELLVVIVILGVLAGIVVFAVGGITNNSTKSACKSDVATAQTAEDAYYAQNNAYVTIPALVTAKLLRAGPTLTGYTFAADTTTGTVTATPAC